MAGDLLADAVVAVGGKAGRVGCCLSAALLALRGQLEHAGNHCKRCVLLPPQLLNTKRLAYTPKVVSAGLYCTALHRTVMSCPVMSCSTLSCTALSCTALSCSVLHCICAACSCKIPPAAAAAAAPAEAGVSCTVPTVPADNTRSCAAPIVFCLLPVRQCLKLPPVYNSGTSHSEAHADSTLALALALYRQVSPPYCLWLYPPFQ